MLSQIMNQLSDPKIMIIRIILISLFMFVDAFKLNQFIINYKNNIITFYFQFKNKNKNFFT